MSILYITIGVAGTGKSTYVKNNLNAKIFSSDDYREKLYGSLEEGNKHNNIVFDTLHKDLRAYLGKGDAVLDATNLSRRRRIHIYNTYGKYVDKVVSIVFVKTLDEILEINKNRPEYKQVPEKILKRMFKTLQVPRAGIDTDEIVVVSDVDSLLADLKIKESIIMEHNSPYHKETVQDHIKRCLELANTDFMREVAKYHDIGKYYTKETYTKSRHENFMKEHATISHFYNHSNVSAMLYLGILKDKIYEDVMEVIYQHNNFYQGSKKIEKELIPYLEEFEVIDDNAREGY